MREVEAQAGCEDDVVIFGAGLGIGNVDVAEGGLPTEEALDLGVEPGYRGEAVLAGVREVWEDVGLLCEGAC